MKRNEDGTLPAIVHRPPGHLSVSEVGLRLGVTRGAVRKYILAGKLRYRTSANGWHWVSEEDLAEFLERQRS